MGKILIQLCYHANYTIYRHVPFKKFMIELATLNGNDVTQVIYANLKSIA